MKKALLWVAGGIAALLLIGTISDTTGGGAGRSDEEKAYLSQIYPEIVSSEDRALVFGHATCTVLGKTDDPSTMSLMGIGQGLQNEDPSLTLSEASIIVGSAIGAFCPEYAYIAEEY